MIESTQTVQQGGAVSSGRVQSRPSVCVVAVVVTWNRRADVERVLRRLSGMQIDRGSIHAIVVDNASDDETSDALQAAFKPERIAANDSVVGSRPSFIVEESPAPNALGLGSLTLVRNTVNLGGCGGFNTGFAAVSEFFGASGTEEGPDFVWLLDDDIDLPTDSLQRLVRAAAVDPTIALVGSRTVDLHDRKTTIESTIYYDRTTGMMGPRREGHIETLAEAVEGISDVDIVSACSMLVRWAAIEGVGPWDDRFFIYCDDADWCLRIKQAGWRVVCALDAVVFHTPWTQKLTPVRGYYLHRNLLLMNSKHLEGSELRRVWLRWSWRLLRDAKSAAFNRAMTQAILTLRAIDDAVRGDGGKLAFEPDACALQDVFTGERARFRDVMVVAPSRDGFEAAETIRAAVSNALIAAGHSGMIPRWRVILRQGDATPSHGAQPPSEGHGRVPIVEFVPTRTGKLRALASLLKRRPDAVIVINHECEFPMLFGGCTLHVNTAEPLRVIIEPGGLRAVLRFAPAWVCTCIRTALFAVKIRRDTRSDPTPPSDG